MPSRSSQSSQVSASVSARKKKAEAQSTARPAAVGQNAAVPSIGSYLIAKLQDSGIRDVFGIPGDFVLNFYSLLEESPIRVIGTTREDCAGYAADAYARVNGMGAVCVTYCVGGLSLCNSIAGAYAEKSPVVVISGAPGMEERRNDPLLHHRVRDFQTQREVFEKITVATASLDDPLTAFREIDRCFAAAARYKRPVYLELPRDRVNSKPLSPNPSPVEDYVSNPLALKAAIEEAADRLSKAKKPVVIAGVEVHRFGLRETLLKFIEKHSIPVSATLLGKSVISERHPLYLGVYEGAMGREAVTKYVEDSDCVVLAGTFMTDINLGIYTAHLDPQKCIYATSEQLRIGYHHFHDVRLDDFLESLASASMKITKRAMPKPLPAAEPFKPEEKKPVTTKRLFQRINQLLSDDMVVVADVGDSLFGASDLVIHQHTEFLSPAYYTSMGFAIPAALGVQVANEKLRPIVLVGDGAFQMTCLELSTILRHSFNPIVVVLNNKGYTTERFLHEGPFNDILNWEYHRLPDLLGGGWGFEVHTESELDQALKASIANEDAFSLLNVHLEPDDISSALTRLAERMSKTI
ncbi:alpha-keto acid decarboxylase family protein [Rubinisphaera margarita]|uniref:alpha-keto acid decarboxylase family protein n=1 Tax=Rubinisphaera margarita TaxID=2909586 RepID=UPI001EE970CF|nr:thiamine pyrophosphate-binding protein [Rubinisphaera margarita]MCG6157144.1 thiamine pyrophosphate-dependent enzyme [Rubinisphaera margarita]